MIKNFHKDLNWFKKFLTKFIGKAFFIKEKVHAQVHLNGCLSGMGAIYDGQVYQIDLPKIWSNQNIATLEMLNVLVAALGVGLKFFCDNSTVISVMNTG